MLFIKRTASSAPSVRVSEYLSRISSMVDWPKAVAHASCSSDRRHCAPERSNFSICDNNSLGLTQLQG